VSAYWKDYWQQHADRASSDEPFVQVQRTLNKQPLSEDLFRRIAAHIVDWMEVDAGHTVLDISCGSGMFTAEVAKNSKVVVGVDFAEKLIEDIALRGVDNIIGVASDVMAVKFTPETFDRVLFAAAIQHFAEGQVVELFRNVANWMKPGGRFMVTDIIDADRIWNFYDSEEREDAYFKNVMDQTPILGTWLSRDWLVRLARHAGFVSVDVIDQPKEFLYSHYRFDLLCKK